MKKRYFIPACVLVVAAIGFIIYAVGHPELSFQWSIQITHILYGLYVDAVVLLFVGMVSMFAYPMTARYRFSLRKILSDSVSIVIGWFPHACALAVLAALLVYAAYRFHYLILFVPAVLGYQIARVNTWIFQKFERFDEKKTGGEQDEHSEM